MNDLVRLLEIIESMQGKLTEDLEQIVTYSNMIDDYVMYNQSRKAREEIKALAKELGRDDVSDIAERKKWYLDSLTDKLYEKYKQEEKSMEKHWTVIQQDGNVKIFKDKDSALENAIAVGADYLTEFADGLTTRESVDELAYGKYIGE